MILLSHPMIVLNSSCRLLFININTVKPLTSGHLRVLKNLFVIKTCPLLGGSFTKIAIFGTIHFVRYSNHVRYLGCPLLGSFTLSCCDFVPFCQKLCSKTYCRIHQLLYKEVSIEVFSFYTKALL